MSSVYPDTFCYDLFGALSEQETQKKIQKKLLVFIVVVIEYTICIPRIAYKIFKEIQDTYVLCRGFIRDKN